jgi:3-hydroxyacyl-[acyl-carrier-protein] dehydratase
LPAAWKKPCVWDLPPPVCNSNQETPMLMQNTGAEHPNTIIKRLYIDPSLPILAGHFPQQPIVPAALQLCWLIDMLRETGQNGHLRIHNAKFLIPLKPGTEAVVTIEVNGAQLNARIESPFGVHTRATILTSASANNPRTA